MKREDYCRSDEAHCIVVSLGDEAQLLFLAAQQRRVPAEAALGGRPGPRGFDYNEAGMPKSLIILAIATLFLAGCQSSSPLPATAAQSTAAQPPAAQTPAPSVNSGDAVGQKLRELAGSGASDCGRLKFRSTPDATRDASSCAMQAAQGKRPFFVAYEMPGLTVGMAGNSEGKLFSLQSETAEGKPGASLQSGPCTAALRVAESGRVTCLPRSSMATSGGPNPHGGMTMPPMQNPHGGMSMPPPGTPNPHSGDTTIPMPRTGKNPPPAQQQ